MYRNELMPPIYVDQPHKDWTIGRWLPLKYQPWTWIPRHINFFGFDFPPRKWAGNAQERPIEVQPDYPLSPETVPYYSSSANMAAGRAMITAIDPILPRGQWAIISARVPFLGRIPVFFTASIPLPKKGKMPIYFGFKPDVTYTSDAPKSFNWSWWFEGSAFSVRYDQ